MDKPVFAYTPPEKFDPSSLDAYPPFLNIDAAGDGLRVTMRGPSRQDGPDPRVVHAGHTASLLLDHGAAIGLATTLWNHLIHD